MGWKGIAGLGIGGEARVWGFGVGRRKSLERVSRDFLSFAVGSGALKLKASSNRWPVLSPI